MCAVSMVGDHYNEKWHDQPWAKPLQPFRVYPEGWPLTPTKVEAVPSVYVSKLEFDALKKDVEEMKALLIRAKEYDERNNEPHCEIEDKVALLKRVAEAVGVDLSEVFK
ncbi:MULTISPECIES: hypothetical protein [unclassified Mesorhizobium]|uniref:hypothetical protein n=1 Tax=unclassified Mesorhizobium TaxID=325217 RepID=UPI001129EB88|nr:MULTISPECIES: hypothetical protein [unclassified Mesorhizobium]TPJ86977.1 hypothetical protein FJ489_30995 [Mesorhizobium sp. B2-5-12]TPK19200.1 hypothetical protein FJ562_31400 [Mesorhizobium sp. B2-5-6]